MHGLELTQRLLSGPEQRSGLLEELAEETGKAQRALAARKMVARRGGADRPVRPRPPRRRPSACASARARRFVRLSISTRSGAWVNPQMLYGKHLGLRGSVAKLAESGDRALPDAGGKRRGDEGASVARGAMRISSVHRFFPVEAKGEVVRVLDPDGGGELAPLRLPAAAAGGGSLPRRLRDLRARPARSPRVLRHDRGRRHQGSRGGASRRGALPREPRARRAGGGDGRGSGRVDPRRTARALGLPRPGGDDAGRLHPEPVPRVPLLASAIPPARTWRTRRASSRCCGRSPSASNSPRAA